MLLKIFEELFDGKLVTWETGSVEFDLKENANPIFSRPYPVLKVQKEMFKKEV